MRLVIDMQSPQAEGRFSRTSPYMLPLAQAIVRNRGEHEVILALSGLFPDTIEPIRAAFDELLPQENIRVWYAPESANVAAHGKVINLLREGYIASLQPDVVLVCHHKGEFDADASDPRIALAVEIPVVHLVIERSRLGDDSNAATSDEINALAKNEADAWMVIPGKGIKDSCVDQDVEANQCVKLLPCPIQHDDLNNKVQPLVATEKPQGELQSKCWDENAGRFLTLCEGICTPHLERPSGSVILNRLINSLGEILSPEVDNKFRLGIAWSIANNHAQKRHRQIYVDVSGLVREDLHTGIQRVIRGLLQAMLNNPPAGYSVEPVYALPHKPGYRHAREFTRNFLNLNVHEASDQVIEPQPGDIFLGLDFQTHVVCMQKPYLDYLHRHGLKTYFVVYDILPIQAPDWFPAVAEVGHIEWLRAITQFDGAICISSSVADELKAWHQSNPNDRVRPFAINWFHLGADVTNSVPTSGLPADAEKLLVVLRARLSFLMVGTIEPRKGHAQTLTAFEMLWREGHQVNLVIVGKQGWMVEDLAIQLRAHPEFGRRLVWLEGISDEYLEKVYAASTCLIAASHGEGFGLPLIEAAQHKLPIIARDIPVFREVAGEHAYYFDGKSPDTLARCIKAWLTLHGAGLHPKSNNMPWLTWQQSARELLENILPQHSRESQ